MLTLGLLGSLGQSEGAALLIRIFPRGPSLKLESPLWASHAPAQLPASLTCVGACSLRPPPHAGVPLRLSTATLITPLVSLCLQFYLTATRWLVHLYFLSYQAVVNE